MGDRPHTLQRGAAGGGARPGQEPAARREAWPPTCVHGARRSSAPRRPHPDRGGGGGAHARHAHTMGAGPHDRHAPPPCPLLGPDHKGPRPTRVGPRLREAVRPTPGRRGPGHTQLRVLWEGSNRSRVFLGPGGDEVRSVFPGKRKQRPVFADGEGQWRWWGALMVPAGRPGGRQVPATSLMPGAVWDRQTRPRNALSSEARTYVSCCHWSELPPVAEPRGEGSRCGEGRCRWEGTRRPGAEGRSGRGSSRPRWREKASWGGG